MAGEKESDSIKRGIDLVIKYRVPQIASQLGLDTKVQGLLEKKLLGAENRTYLWLHLIMEDIVERGAQVNTSRKLARFLDQLPTSLDTAYENMLKRSPKPGDARKIFQILLAAQRPLRLREMNMALNIQKGDESRDDVDLDPENTFATNIRDVCGLFVTVNIADSVIYFIHQTARDFLICRDHDGRLVGQGNQPHDIWRFSIRLKDTHCLLAHICFYYLSFTTFKVEPSGAGANLWPRATCKAENELLEYAADHWHYHLQMAEMNEVPRHSWSRICSSGSWSFRAWFNRYWSAGRHHDSRHLHDSQINQLLLFATAFQCMTIFEILLVRNINVNEADFKCMADLWAAHKDQRIVLRQLLENFLEKGASADFGSFENITKCSDLVMMQTLIRHGALSTIPISRLSILLGNLLLEIMPKKHVEVECLPKVKLLIANGACLRIIDQRNRSALTKAIEYHKFNIAKLLLSNAAMSWREMDCINFVVQLVPNYKIAKDCGAIDITDTLREIAGGEERVKVLLAFSENNKNYWDAYYDENYQFSPI